MSECPTCLLGEFSYNIEELGTNLGINIRKYV